MKMGNQLRIARKDRERRRIIDLLLVVSTVLTTVTTPLYRDMLPVVTSN